MSEPGSSPKRDDFVRLANQRVAKTLKQIELVGNLSNRYRYEFSEKDVRTIFGELETALRTARRRFEQPTKAGHSFRIDQ